MQGTREIAIALLLRAHERMSVRDLARVLKVSERTIARDRAELALAGITITTSRGPGGGYALAPGSRITPGHFARTLVRAAAEGGANAMSTQELDVNTEQELRLALREIKESLPVAHRAAFVRAMEEVFAPLAHGASDGEEAPLYVIRRALWRCQRLRIHYVGQDGATSERLIEPSALVPCKGSWYLVGYCHWREDVRAFALTKIKRAQIADGVAEMPDTIELARLPRRPDPASPFPS